MGSISAFYAAGATSVIGTLWPTDNADAIKVFQAFYQAAFLARPMHIANLARAMQKAVLTMRAAEEDVYDVVEPRMCKTMPGSLIIGHNSSSRGRGLRGGCVGRRRLLLRDLPQKTLLMQEGFPMQYPRMALLGKVKWRRVSTMLKES